MGRIAGVRWEDSQSGFRLIRKKILDRLELRSEGFAIEMEIAMKAADWKLRWAHIPIQAIYHPGPPAAISAASWTPGSSLGFRCSVDR